MAYPTTFATLPAGNNPASLLDTMFAIVGGMGNIQCTASGANTIVLTPVANMPTVSAYSALQTFSFQAVGPNTGAVTVNAGPSALPLIMPTGRPLVAGDILTTQLVEVMTDTVNFYMISPASSTNSTVQFASVASAATCNVWANGASSGQRHVTGAVGITSFGTAPFIGAVMTLTFDSNPLITNNANIVTGTGGNVTPSAGTTWQVVADTTTSVRFVTAPATAGATSVVTVTKQTFTATGTYTPTTGMLFCLVEMVGGGGGGGNGSAASNGSGGGGAGQYSRALLTAAQIGASKAITIPAAAGGGSAGGTVTLTTLCTAVGGSSGAAGTANISNGGAGGTGGTSDIATTGAPGQWGAGTTGLAAIIGGAGGSSPFGGGGANVNGVGSANSGTGFGSGGGGSGGNNGGGAGTKGVVYITEYCSV